MNKKRSGQMKTINYHSPTDEDKAILAGKICGYCGTAATVACSSTVYGHTQYGKIALCPNCYAYIGYKQGNPLGSLANADLRGYRSEAHKFFGSLCKLTEKVSRVPAAQVRTAGYQWLARRMSIQPAYCHIGMFGPFECEEAVRVSWEALEVAVPMYQCPPEYLNLSYFLL